MRVWWSKIRALLTGRRGLASELREELEAHLEMAIEENQGDGMSADQARRLARLRFGNTTLIHERAHEAWVFTAIENVAKDVMNAGRTVRKSLGFAITTVLTLALGIGGVTAMFTVIRTVLLKPLDYPDAERLVEVLVSNARQGLPDSGLNRILYLELQAAPAFSGFGAVSGIRESVTIATNGSEPESVTEARVSANFVDILGVNPLLGRGFLPEEDRPGGPNVALISYGLWKRRFGGDPQTVGRAITLDARSYTVVGILPPHFEFPWTDYDVWVTRPWEWAEVAPESWDRAPILRGLARLKRHVTLDQARTEADVIAGQYSAAHPGLVYAGPSMAMHVDRLENDLVRNLRALLWMLFVAVGFVLLIICANVAGLLLARSAVRSRELAVRSALGASRWRLIQQTFAESVPLALLGAVVGVFVARAILAAIMHGAPFDVPRADEIHMDGAVLAFAAAVSIASGLLFGWLPSLRFSRPELTDFLREQGALAGRASFAGFATARSARKLLVVAQVALCVMLLMGASLMLESFVRLRDVDPGFQPARLLTMQIALPTARYNTSQKKQAFWDDLVRRVSTLPGVVDCAVSRSIPTTIPDATSMRIAEQPKNVHALPGAVPNIQSATPDYFRVFGIPLIRGREFTAQDRDGAPRVAIINERLARRFWPNYPKGPDPLDQHLLVGNKEIPYAVVGIIGDVHEDALGSDVKPEAYFPSAQLPPQTAYFAVKTAGPSEGLGDAVRAQVSAIDAGQSISHVQSMGARLSASLGGHRLTLMLVGSFAAVALVIALMGIYGVMAFLVVERTQEFGIRLALGAQRGDILRLVLAQGLRLVLSGLVFGIIGGFTVARIMKAALFHVSATDPLMFSGVSLLFVAVGLAACYLPARRATRMDPASALR